MTKPMAEPTPPRVRPLREQIHYIYPFVKPYRYALMAGVLTLIITDVLNLIIPYLMSKGIDSLKATTVEHNALIYFAVLIAVIAFVRAFFRFGWRWYLLGASQGFERDIRLDYFKHTMNLPLPFFARNRIGELIALSANDVVAVKRAVGEGVLTFSDFIVSFIGILYFMIDISPTLTLYAIIPMPIISGLFIYFGPKIHARFMEVQDSFGALTTDAEESIAGMRVVRSYTQEEGECKRFARANDDFLKKNMRLVRIDATFHTLMFLIPSLIFPLILYLGGRLIIEGQITVGEFIAFNMYIGQLVWPMMAIGWTFNIFQRAGASVERLRDVFGEKSEFTGEVPSEVKPDTFHIRHLTFFYPGAEHPALKDVSLDLPIGKTTAIMGRTGAGKSTLTALLLRLYDPPRGTIFLGERDILDIPKVSLRQLFGTAPQTPFLFTDTIEDNIAFALDQQKLDELGVVSAATETLEDEHATAVENDVVQCAKDAHIYEDIMLMPDKFKTIVGERGTTLSGGQRQRTAIARAFRAQHPIMLLDDPLSAIDTVTESRILHCIRHLREHSTLFIVTHRINAAELADQVVVLENGSLQACGKPETMCKESAFYAEVYDYQMRNN